MAKDCKCRNEVEIFTGPEAGDRPIRIARVPCGTVWHLSGEDELQLNEVIYCYRCRDLTAEFDLVGRLVFRMLTTPNQETEDDSLQEES